MSRRLEFAHRAQRYQALHADPQICARTGFFAAAAAICSAFAYAPATAFVAQLSGALELFNTERAQKIRAGELYHSGAVAANTEDFIRAEQALVQRHLDRLRAEAPHAYRLEIERADRLLFHAARSYATFAGKAVANLNTALCEVRHVLGRSPCFETQSDREHIGNALARMATLNRHAPALLMGRAWKLRSQLCRRGLAL
jgi:hypothetical protein